MIRSKTIFSSNQSGRRTLGQLLAERVIEFFRPMRERRRELAASPDHVEKVLAAGVAKVRPILEATMAEVRAAVGIGPRGR